jgi:hypothetical protein
MARDPLHEGPRIVAGNPGHESDEIRIRGFVWFLVAFIGTAVVIHVLLYWIFGLFFWQQPRTPASALADQRPLPAEPRLQGSAIHGTLPKEDLKAMREKEDALLNNYAWVNRQAGDFLPPVRSSAVPFAVGQKQHFVQARLSTSLMTVFVPSLVVHQRSSR